MSDSTGPDGQGRAAASRDSDLRPSAVLLSTIGEIGEQITTICDKLGRAEAGVKTYAGALDKVGKDLSDPRITARRLKDKVGEMLSATTRIAEQNSALQVELRSSNTEIGRLRQRIEQLHSETITDPVTKIFNRKWFDHSLDFAIEAADERSRPLCLLMVDIDRFKRFNDQHGRRLGDRVLRLVAKALSDCTTGQDIVARHGGDQFVAILPNTEIEDAEKLGRNVIAEVAKKKIADRRSKQVIDNITVSVGGAAREAGQRPDEFLDRAEKALRDAKASGRNTVRVIGATNT